MTERNTRVAPGVGLAVLAALLFGASTPVAHRLLNTLPPVLLSALLYLGSGMGLAMLALFWPESDRRRIKGLPDARGVPASPGEPQPAPPGHPPANPRSGGLTLWLRHPGPGLQLAGAILCGGVLAPVALLYGMQSTPASATALLLNVESVFTALLAWWVFGEGVDAGIAAGMLCVTLGGVLLAWPEAGIAPALRWQSLRGPGLILLACFGWALDNNLTRGAAMLDARLIARWKGLCAGGVNLLLAGWLAGGVTALLTQLQQAGPWIAVALLTGWLGYGISLVAYVRAQARMGAARTGAWFGLAPFVGVAIALLVLHEPAPTLLWPAGVLIAGGLWLHLRERHLHWHVHPGTQADGLPVLHRHVHFPDLQHRHAHRTHAHAVTVNDSLLDPALIAAYHSGTTYIVNPSPGVPRALHLRVGQADPALQALVQGLAGAVFITASNPFGKALTAAENAARHAALLAMLHDAGLRTLEGAGVGDRNDWPAETSVLVPDMSRADALLLGAHWQQNAVVWVGAGGVPELLLLR